MKQGNIAFWKDVLLSDLLLMFGSSPGEDVIVLNVPVYLIHGSPHLFICLIGCPICMLSLNSPHCPVDACPWVFCTL